MYADRYTGSGRFNPAGLAAAMVIGALLFAAPYVGITPPGGSIDIYDVPIDPVPPEPTPQPPQDFDAIAALMQRLYPPPRPR